MSRNLLEMITAVADECTYAVDSSVIGSSDITTKQLLSMANRVIREAGNAYAWPQLVREGFITLVASVGSYALPEDTNFQLIETHWNRNESWILYGPLSPQDRQFIKSGYIERLPYQRFSVIGLGGTKFEIDPSPTASEAGQLIAFEYISDRCVRPRQWEAGQVVAVDDYTFNAGEYYKATSAGTTGATAPTHTSGSASDDNVTWEYYEGSYQRFLADTDVPNIDPLVIEQGILERFAERKGLQVEPRYELQLLDAFNRAEPGKVLSMSTNVRTRFPNSPRTEWAI